MENINGKNRASFRWMLSCAVIGLLAASVSPCFAQENRQNASQEMQRLQEMQRVLAAPLAPEAQWRGLVCDSLVLKVCVDIYRRRMEQMPERTLYEEPCHSAVRWYESGLAGDHGRTSLPCTYRFTLSPRP
jgi:hypothetical protein